MESKELADAIKVAASVFVAGGVLTAGVWRVVRLFSKKDNEINKGYNRALKVQMDADKELAETNHSNLKEDVGELKIEVVQVLKGMSDLTIELRSSNEINKAVIDSNIKLMESKNEEVATLKKSISLHEKKYNSDHEEWKQKLKQISEGVVNMLDDPEIKRHLNQLGIDLNERMDEIEKSLKKVDGSADDELKERINELAKDLKETKKEFRQLSNLRINACKEKKIVDLLTKPFEEENVKKAE